MDLIDILMARALTPQVQIETAAATANRAVAQATTALNDANTAITNAQTALTDANAAKDLADEVTQQLQEKIDDIEYLFPTEEEITEQLDTKVDKFQGISNEGKTFIVDSEGYVTLTNRTDNLGANNAGKIVVINSDGTITNGVITEEAIIEALLQNENVTLDDVVGLQVDYANKTFIRTQEAQNLAPGTNFNQYEMYAGRKRCNVADNGRINAFYGETGYTEDGSNGQVMVYQPKFYYSRIPMVTENGVVGKIVRKETFAISYEEKPGFKLHPIFKGSNGEEFEYVLLSAYEGCGYDTSVGTYDLNDSSTIDFTTDKLSSIAGAKPISGVNKAFTVANAERMAQNRGTGWHIMNMAAESANQMLALIELGTMNGQAAIELGICQIPNNASANCSSLTGSTQSLGSITGAATETINETNGTVTTYNTNGRRAISYRGMENPWGNLWRMVGGVNIYGNTLTQGGIPYICKNFNYTPTEQSSNYDSVGFCLPTEQGWISAMGYGSEDYDWVIMPAECSGANSLLPVGDNLWVTPSLNGINMCLIGGMWYFEDNDGLFYYGCDNRPTISQRSISARLMYVPTQKDTIYNDNITKWNQTRR